MKKKYFFLSVSYILFTSCLSQNSAITEQTSVQPIETFSEQKKLQAEKIRINELFSTDGIEIKGNALFIIDSKSNDTILYQYSLPDMQCVYKGGRRGGAENEFQLPPSFCKSTTDKIYLFGYKPSLIKSFSIDSHNQLKIEQEFSIPTGPVLNFMNIVNDSLLICSALPYQLNIKKINLDSQKSTGEIVIEQDEHKEIFFDENKGYLAANDSLIIYAYTYKKQIDLYRTSDMKLHKRLINEKISPHIVIGNIQETAFQHREIVACKKHFYIRCPKKGGGCFIEVYDYSGHSIARYELDIPLYTFNVDEENRTIYGYNGDLFEDGILKYTY